MRRFFDVSSLTRPQRIRCRPTLLISPCPTIQIGRYSLPAPKPYQRSKDHDRIRPSGNRQIDELDYEDALQAYELVGWQRGGVSSSQLREDQLDTRGQGDFASEIEVTPTKPSKSSTSW